ncbi:2-oxo acid dehydrogenase subunit E2 [Amycolatopsis keratiniphila]|uniref:Dihydrolipoamide acetyltransferase component of pyruvate dehydrogenase complex n=1 Tax=Amycolatopsis keratiniphila subsp. keratiniphila TaxID=227715 RepID=A0A1W2M480_9PSEU|nr:2-oxo acid dehydrogenase subunit E2 [Amycolatopsis keratiniphila]ONF75005.1 hypothetical protein AVR91_0200335 [Amycolatopsis keratiniphila subsp. keratiniphila]
MTDIVVPKLNNNDLSYTLIDWLVPSGTAASYGDAIAEIETSKATHEITCPSDGVVLHTIEAGTECTSGDIIGRVTDPATMPDEPLPVPAQRKQTADTSVITAPALARATELGIPEERLLALGKPVIRSADVDSMAEHADVGGEQQAHRFSRNQRAVAAVVALSHQTIPAAFATVTVRVEEALATARHLTKHSTQFVGLPDLLVKALAVQRRAHPLLFATRVDDHTATLAANADIGVTLDLGHGLYIPVVPDAENLTCPQIAETLAGYKTKALDGSFATTDLDGANIVLSLHNDPDIVLAGPIVHPGHTCAVTLAGTRTELTLTPEGAPLPQQVATISLTYDHRVVNGRDATGFLRDLKNTLETPTTPALTTTPLEAGSS